MKHGRWDARTRGRAAYWEWKTERQRQSTKETVSQVSEVAWETATLPQGFLHHIMDVASLQ